LGGLRPEDVDTVRILLVEPYFDGSHRSWAEGYVAHSRHTVHLLTHPGRWWKWRMRGSALTLAQSAGSLGSWVPDLVLITDMTDLAHFRFFTRDSLGEVPVALYVHESQLTYPTPDGDDTDLSYAFTNWLSAYSADRVLFNSEYHRDVFFGGLPRLLRNFPDMNHDHLIDEVAARSEVLTVGVDLSWVHPQSTRNAPPRILWNHRWDHDKDPDAFADAISQLVDADVSFELILLGPRPPQPPPALLRLREVAGHRIIHDGEVEIDLYRDLVSSCDIVVSTALQEFFGISVVEAIAAGCRPVLPNRLSYPSLIPQRYHDSVLYPDGGLAESLITAIADPGSPPGLASSMDRYSWDAMASEYDDRLEAIAGV
jgi:glycosyltransferase involved in cell wall biosynthesis